MIRKVKKEELFSVYRLNLELFKEDAWDYQGFVASFKKGDYFLIAEKNNSLVGFLVITKILDQAEILKIGVKKEFQGKGIGKELLQKALAQLKKEGIREIFLEVRESNKIAQKLYEKLGFKVIGKRKEYYSKEDAIIMKKVN